MLEAGESIAIDGVIAVIGQEGADYKALIEAHESGASDESEETSKEETPKSEEKSSSSASSTPKASQESSSKDGERVKASN